MSSTSKPGDKVNPADLSALFGQYLRKQIAAHAEGKGYPEPSDEVFPYEATPIQPVDPALAWTEALSIAKYLPGVDAAEVAGWKVTPDWPVLVNSLQPTVALPFALGNFPQLVRDLYPLLTGAAPLTAEPSRPQQGTLPGLVDWAASLSTGPQQVLAVAILRLAGYREDAETRSNQITGLSEGWQALLANEQAALLWEKGDREGALKLWEEQTESIPVLFNRGMALLFLERLDEAQVTLKQAVTQLPETCSWHHLGRLYLTLIKARLPA